MHFIHIAMVQYTQQNKNRVNVQSIKIAKLLQTFFCSGSHHSRSCKYTHTLICTQRAEMKMRVSE